ncbi:MAG: DUF3047 domain-containing protein [Gemmatimonadales bacterium]
MALLSQSLDFLDLGSAALGAGVPAEWEVRPVRGYPAPTLTITDAGGVRALRIAGSGSAAFVYRELDRPIREVSGSLKWTWRVLRTPKGADLRSPETDDAGLRVFVVFGKPGGLFGGSGRVVFYTWGNTEPIGLSQPSFASGRIQIVRVAGAEDVEDGWREEIVDPFADYRRFWNRNPPPITRVGIMQDTDMTKSPASAELSSLIWETGGE